MFLNPTTKYDPCLGSDDNPIVLYRVTIRGPENVNTCFC